MADQTIYKQEGKFGMYTILPPMLAGVSPEMRAFIPTTYCEIWGFFKSRYGYIYLVEEEMERIARSVIAISSNGLPDAWKERLDQIDSKLTACAYAISKKDLAKESEEDLLILYQELERCHYEMWALTIFVDGFDIGIDQREIAEISARHGLSDVQVQAFLTPSKLSYLSDWSMALGEYAVGKLPFDRLRERFFWYMTDYGDFAELDKISADIMAKELQEDVLEVKKEVEPQENPLALYRDLATWRDDRKRLNFTGIYGMVRILYEVFSRQGIPEHLVFGLFPHEVVAAFAGGISQETLEKRVEQGVFFHAAEGAALEWQEGDEAAESLRNMELSLDHAHVEELVGMVASRGKATGTARLIFDPNSPEAKRMQEGDILVTGMTRPEFVPLIKKAGAIVTNEGGISCHAAIISRELGIPCVIGTKVATKVIPDGALVEVDAFVGVVRVL